MANYMVTNGKDVVLSFTRAELRGLLRLTDAGATLLQGPQAFKHFNSTSELEAARRAFAMLDEAAATAKTSDMHGGVAPI